MFALGWLPLVHSRHRKGNPRLWPRFETFIRAVAAVRVPLAGAWPSAASPELLGRCGGRAAREVRANRLGALLVGAPFRSRPSVAHQESYTPLVGYDLSEVGFLKPPDRLQT